MAENEIDWDVLKGDLLHALEDLKAFFRHPLQAMTTVPKWNLVTSLIVAGGLGVFSGVLAAILNRSFMGFLASLFIVPFSSIVFLALASGFFYYVFLLIFKMQVHLRELFIVSIFAAIPTFLCVTLSQILPPIMLIGVAASLYLLRIAYLAVFNANRPLLNKILVGLFVFYAACWVMNSLNLEKGRQSLKKMATPESLDILEKELHD